MQRAARRDSHLPVPRLLASANVDAPKPQRVGRRCPACIPYLRPTGSHGRGMGAGSARRSWLHSGPLQRGWCSCSGRRAQPLGLLTQGPLAAEAPCTRQPARPHVGTLGWQHQENHARRARCNKKNRPSTSVFIPSSRTSGAPSIPTLSPLRGPDPGAFFMLFPPRSTSALARCSGAHRRVATLWPGVVRTGTAPRRKKLPIGLERIADGGGSPP